VGAEKISSLSANKIARSLPMNTCLPVSIEVTVTLAAESIALREIDQFSVEKPKLIPVLCIVAIEAPSHGFSMMEFDVSVLLFEFSLFPIGLHGGMTIAARKHALRDRWRGDRKLLHPHRKRCEINCQEKNEYDWGIYFLHAYEEGGKKRGAHGLAPNYPSAESAGPISKIANLTKNVTKFF